MSLRLLLLFFSIGCTSPQQWWESGLKVGPNYSTERVPTGQEWLDSGNDRLRSSIKNGHEWWSVFNDPVLNELITNAYLQNLSLRAAFLRIEDARLQRDIAAGNFYPQSQFASGSYSRNQMGRNFFDSWSNGLNLSWELDLWGRLRRQIASADAALEANEADTNAVLVCLVANVASTYIEIRSLDERIRMAKQNVEIQEFSYDTAERKARILKTEIDEKQALSNLEDTKALIPSLDRQRRNAINRLAILLGVTPDRMRMWVETDGRLPEIPEELFVGIPCEVIRRRPDILAAERDLAAQAEQIGIAEADFYPSLSVGGSISVTANSLSDLYTTESTTASIGPSFQWKILNYGRIGNNVLLQENRYQQALVNYHDIALRAQQEVEDGIIDFLRFHDQKDHQQISADAAVRTAEIGQLQYKEGKTAFNSLFVYQSDLVNKQDALIQTKANIAFALINTYKALGGGWELRQEIPYAGEHSPIPERVSPMPVAPPPVPAPVAPPAENAQTAADRNGRWRPTRPATARR